MKKTPKTLKGCVDIGDCPFCGGKLSVSLKPQSVIHSQPICQVFVDKDVNEFLIAVRRERAKKPLW